MSSTGSTIQEVVCTGVRRSSCIWTKRQSGTMTQSPGNGTIQIPVLGSPRSGVVVLFLFLFLYFFRHKTKTLKKGKRTKGFCFVFVLQIFIIRNVVTEYKKGKMMRNE
eukprot:PhF_6_TR28317/c0_g1_i1/m.41945